jgi:hypothetical protein
MMGERPDRAGPPPAIFWRAPKDSASVVYGRGTDPKKFAPILRTGRQLVEGVLGKYNIGSSADHRALGELVDLPIGKDVETVTASGRMEVAEPKDNKRTPQQQVDALVDGWLGWSLFGYEESSAAVAKYLRKFAEVYGRKGFQDPATQQLGPELSKLIPKVKVSSGPASLGPDSLDFSVKIEGIPAGLLNLKGTTEKDRVNFEAHLVLMTDGKSRTWIAVGAGKPDHLVKRLLAVKTGAPDGGTIASRADLEPLRRGRHMGAGFMTMGPLVKSLHGSKMLFERHQDPMVERVVRALSTMPNQGNTPIFLTTSVSGAEAPRGEIGVSASKQVLEDIGWLLKTLGPR